MSFHLTFLDMRSGSMGFYLDLQGTQNDCLHPKTRGMWAIVLDPG